MKHLLALDIGTSSVKAALFDADGRQLAVATEEYALERPAPDLVELDPETYWAATRAAIGGVLAASHLAPREIAALGVTSQGETLIILDRDNRPLRKAIVWLDNRAVAEARAIASHFDPSEVYRRTGQQEVVPGWTAAKILWVREHEPEVFRAAAKFLLVEDFILHRLTGRFATDHALNPSTLYYDLTTGDWWNDMLAFLGIAAAQLPALRASGSVVGGVTADVGLHPGTLVVTTPIDQIAGAVGAGNIRPGMLTETTGSALALCATCAQPRYDPLRRVGLYRHAVGGAYALLPWVPTAGMILRWFRDELGGGRNYAELDSEAANVPAGSDGLTLLPHFGGAVCPEIDPAARGVLHGLTLGHRRAHLVRAILESVAYQLRDNVEMLASLGVPTARICSLGGGARSVGWLQMKADVLDREIATVDADEVTCLGAALLAAVGAGVHGSIETAVDRMVRTARTFVPVEENVQLYAAHYAKYRELNRQLLPTFGKTP